MTTTEDKYTFPRAITKDIDIHKACRAGDIPKIRAILSKCPSLINYQDDRLGWTPLYRATMSGYYDTVAILLEYKADPNIKNNVYPLTRSKKHRSIRQQTMASTRLLRHYYRLVQIQTHNRMTGILHCIWPASKETTKW
jgi:ankyrin repeat protein